MSGTGAAAFSPNQTLTRAMVAQVLYSMEGAPAGGTSTFTDVAAGTWYASAVNWAAANGVVSGYGDGTFGPNDNVTREQVAMILYSFAKSKDTMCPRRPACLPLPTCPVSAPMHRRL